MKLPNITVTGIDPWTPIDQLGAIVDDHEVGILVSDSPERDRPRYQAEPWIGLVIGEYWKYINFALHICGTNARLKLRNGHYDHWLKYVERVQINGVVSPVELSSICATYPDTQFITQHGNPHNGQLVELEIKTGNHSLLLDASGGRGIMPSEWIMPATIKRVGFAGGLGPNEMTENLPKIIKAANGTDYWIDMEGKIRTDDKFDIEKVRQVFDEIRQIP